MCESRVSIAVQWVAYCFRVITSKHHAIDLATKFAMIDAVEAGTRSKTEVPYIGTTKN